MILTITANPSVDLYYNLSKLNINDITRCNNVQKTAGGKGIHVGYVLKQLGKKVIHSGFVGGNLGEFLEKDLANRGHNSRFIKIKNETRNCIAILHEGNQTEILEAGPYIDSDEEKSFIDDLDKITNDCNVISISGSLPNGLDSDFYKKIIKYAKINNKLIALDTSGKTLKEIINSNSKPDIIKPNESELKELIGIETSKNDIKSVLLEGKLRDIKYVIVSLGRSGAVAKINGRIYEARVPEIKSINPVGCGDSSLAGAISAIEDGKSDIEIIKTSMTCGLLNALTEEIAYIEVKDFAKYYEKIKVKEI